MVNKFAGADRENFEKGGRDRTLASYLTTLLFY